MNAFIKFAVSLMALSALCCMPVSAQETKAHEVKRIKQIKKSEVNLNVVFFITDLLKSKFQLTF